MNAVDRFVEDLAQWFESSGMPRITGRVVAYLLVCDPPEQSAEDLATALDASRGSISAATRLLATAGLIERVTFRGDRRTYHRAVPDWSSLLAVQLQRLAELRRLLEQGRAALGGEVPARRERLDGINAFATFWHDELTAVLARTAPEQPPEGGTS